MSSSKISTRLLFSCRGLAVYVDQVSLRHMAMAECVLRPRLGGVSCLKLRLCRLGSVVRPGLYLAPSIAASRVVALSYSVLPWHIESTC